MRPLEQRQENDAKSELIMPLLSALDYGHAKDFADGVIHCGPNSIPTCYPFPSPNHPSLRKRVVILINGF